MFTKKIHGGLNEGNACHSLVQNLSPSCVLLKNVKLKVHIQMYNLIGCPA
jgi:hypothetical protein